MSPTKIQSLREKSMIDIAPDGILWVDANGQILFANPAMERLTGYLSTVSNRDGFTG
ncbi:MAG: PAS domain-containing protein [Rhodoferax sp.]|uniref:PAS domain-containing protein n=1 Tax=Rhodoferax sp. TaxID=50421 RepID=UPI00183731C7|nr:PAS domain-containing protein [Rhodoferax sp.]NMM19556.1 PAS domain-containing protein [Rhodoferax sp.]